MAAATKLPKLCWLACIYCCTQSFFIKAQAETPALALSLPNAIASHSEPRAHDERRVRISLRLTPYERRQEKRPSGRSHFTMKPQAAERFTLRAHAERVNHFFFHGFHVETHPLASLAKEGRWGSRLVISRVFGREGAIEETLGELTFQGTLEGSTETPLVQGFARRQLSNKFGEPILDIAIGDPRLAAQSGLAAAGRGKASPPQAKPPAAAGATRGAEASEQL